MNFPESEKVCVKCGSTMHLDEIYCRICGANNTRAPTPEGGVTFRDILYCPNCSVHFNAGDKFCTNCGQPLPETAPRNTHAADSVTKRSIIPPKLLLPKNIVIAAALLTALILTFITVFIILPASA